MTLDKGDAPMLIQAALNGDRSKTDHDAVPLSIEALVEDAAACVAAGSGAIHLHPRDAEGQETLKGDVVNATVRQVRQACGVPVGVTTEASIEPDLERRLAMIRTWTEPDYTSVNISEPGSVKVIQALIETGIGIEAGVWTVEDAEELAASGLGGHVLRVLVEPGEMQVGTDIDAALALVEEIHRTLDDHGLTAPRLQHGDGAITWALVEDAFKRGMATRIGLEDTLRGPDGAPVSGNAELVRIAHGIRGDQP